jgi:Ser/Thr protein kinase RdoA (MazF antagonist)
MPAGAGARADHAGFRAAVEVAHQLGLATGEAHLIQETNNTVVWLRPHPVIAKVATRPGNFEDIIREHAVASALAAGGAPIAAPLPGAGPVEHPATGFVVTLWERLEGAHGPVPGPVVAAALRRLHHALASCAVELPSFLAGLRRARRALADDTLVAALPSADRAVLRAAYDGLLADLAGRTFSERPLHGEPHDGNSLLTPAGLRWIDFENACRGPLEWDLAFLPDDAHALFGEIDHDLLDLLRTLNSARVATWCFVQARFPEMRRHGEMHLALVRAGRPARA